MAAGLPLAPDIGMPSSPSLLPQVQELEEELGPLRAAAEAGSDICLQLHDQISVLVAQVAHQQVPST